MDILVPLTENHEYKRVYARGKSAVRPALVLYCLRNKKVKQARVGITASKKIGNAVKRNRARRLVALPKDKNNSAKTAENDSERTSETGEETASVTKEELS